jgi:hypothetical protein
VPPARGAEFASGIEAGWRRRLRLRLREPGAGGGCPITKTKIKYGVLFYDSRRFGSDIGAWRIEMAKKATKIRPWTKEDVRTLKTLAREKTKTSVIARKLKRTERATYQKARALSVKLGGVRGKKKRA